MPSPYVSTAAGITDVRIGVTTSNAALLCIRHRCPQPTVTEAPVMQPTGAGPVRCTVLNPTPEPLKNWNSLMVGSAIQQCEAAGAPSLPSTAVSHMTAAHGCWPLMTAC